MTGIATILGVITIVQERRFQLADEDGVRHLFVLGEAAPLDERQLRRCADSRTRVRVHYREAPSLIARLAVGIDEETKEQRNEAGST